MFLFDVFFFVSCFPYGTFVFIFIVDFSLNCQLIVEFAAHFHSHMHAHMHMHVQTQAQTKYIHAYTHLVLFFVYRNCVTTTVEQEKILPTVCPTFLPVGYNAMTVLFFNLIFFVRSLVRLFRMYRLNVYVCKL